MSSALVDFIYNNSTVLFNKLFIISDCTLTRSPVAINSYISSLTLNSFNDSNSIRNYINFLNWLQTYNIVEPFLNKFTNLISFIIPYSFEKINKIFN